MNHTEKEIALCRRLHELGVRPEIREGDWYLDSRHSLAPFGPFLCTGEMIPDLRDIFVLLWTWERAREWLREKGLFNVTLQTNYEISDLSVFSLTKEAMRKFIAQGQTDLECALAVMVQVAEEGK